MSVFEDQKKFMRVCGQTPSFQNVQLYKRLIAEEYQELLEAWYKLTYQPAINGGDDDHKDYPDHVAEIADACLDLIYVTVGMMHSLGLRPQQLWDEVQRSNMSKFVKRSCSTCDGIGSVSESTDIGLAEKPCPSCDGAGFEYEVIRREDGKILKPDTFSPPDLATIVRWQYAR